MLQFGRFVAVLSIVNALTCTYVFGQDMFYFDPAPVSQDVIDGEVLVLRCDVSSRKMISFYWTLNGKSLANNSRRYQDNSDLRFTRVDKTLDVGSFRCVATNYSTGIAIRSAEAILNILWIDQKPVKIQDVSDSATTDVILKCDAGGNPEPSIEWFRNRMKLFANDRNKFSKNRIKLFSPTASDNGVYSCRASNPAGHTESGDNFLLSVPERFVKKSEARKCIDVPLLHKETFTEQVIAKQRMTATFVCQFTGAVYTRWYFEQTLIVNSTKYHLTNNGTMFVNRVDMEDAGVYHCVGVGPKGPDQVYTSQLLLAYLDDLSDASFDPQLGQSHIIPVGGKTEVRCHKPKGIPIPSLKWLNPSGSSIPDQGRIRASDGSLFIHSAEESDSGNYTCLAENMAAIRLRSIHIFVSVPPKITRSSVMQNVQEGDSVNFECKYAGPPYPISTVTWRKDGNAIDLQNSRYSLSETSGRLTIANVRPADEGSYSCTVATKGHSPATAICGHLQVAKGLQFKQKPSNTMLQLGMNVTIACSAEGRTPPIVFWRKVGFNLMPDHVRERDGNLQFYRVRQSDAGIYICVAANDQGNINATILIDVIVKPVLYLKPVNTSVYEGGQVMLHCGARGEPTPTIRWDKNNDKSVLDMNRFKMFNNGSLFLSEAYMEDTGQYGCTAANSGGSQRHEVYLEVTDLHHSVDHITTSTDDSSTMIKTIVIVVCAVVGYLGIMIVLAIYCIFRRTRRKQTREQKNIHNISAMHENTQLMEKKELNRLAFRCDSDSRSHCSGNSQTTSCNANFPCSPAFPRHQLQTFGILGRGYYGEVALARNLQPGSYESLVIVKSLLMPSLCHEQEFNKDIKLFDEIDHPNVTRLLGFCCSIKPPIAIFEYCDRGDLKQFLKSSTDNILSVGQQLEICYQVALGMEHMSTMQLLHCDLAARNILISSKLNIKISKLSLCRDVYAGEYFHFNERFIPIRWMPAEAVFNSEYSVKSDVWSFGIFALEVFTNATLPFPEKTDEDVLLRLKLDGSARISCSHGCPEQLWNLIRCCTEVLAVNRPTFSEVVAVMGGMIIDSRV